MKVAHKDIGDRGLSYFSVLHFLLKDQADRKTQDRKIGDNIACGVISQR
jgi:hypothetical protein